MLQLLLSDRARPFTHLVGWLFVALLFFSLISGFRDLQEALNRTAVHLIFLIALFYGHARILVNRFFEKGRYWQMGLFTLALWLGTAALRTEVEFRLFGTGIFQKSPEAPGAWWQLFSAYLLIFFLLLLFSTLYQLLENRYTLELRHRELEARHAEAQLQYLKAQINPHFLFNTLNNIYAAATLQHPNTANMVLRLSDLLRYVTYDTQEQRVTLGKEIDQIKAYLELFQLSTEQPMAIRLELEDDYQQIQIEPMLLLPLVENAVKHGDLNENPDGTLTITLRHQPDRLTFQVKNSFNAKNRQKDPAGGVGLQNIRQRLDLYYPQRHRFDIRMAKGIFTAILEIDHPATEPPATAIPFYFNPLDYIPAE